MLDKRVVPIGRRSTLLEQIVEHCRNLGTR